MKQKSRINVMATRQNFRFDPPDELQDVVQLVVTKALSAEVPETKGKKFLRAMRKQVIHEIVTEINTKNFRKSLHEKLRD